MIKKTPKIEGLRVGACEIKITQYADGTTVFLKSPESMSLLLDLLEKFESHAQDQKLTTQSQKQCGWENGKTEKIPHSMLSGQKTLFVLQEYNFQTRERLAINLTSMKNWMFWKRPFIGRDRN